MALQQSSGSWINRGVHQEIWPAMGNADVGSILNAPHLPHKVVSVQGTFGAAGGMIIEGNNDGGATYEPLHDPSGNVLTFTQNGSKRIDDAPPYVRPRATGGDGTTSLVVRITSQKY